jgi:hypothetical protein
MKVTGIGRFDIQMDRKLANDKVARVFIPPPPVFQETFLLADIEYRARAGRMKISVCLCSYHAGNPQQSPLAIYLS